MTGVSCSLADYFTSFVFIFYHVLRWQHYAEVKEDEIINKPESKTTQRPWKLRHWTNTHITGVCKDLSLEELFK